MSIAELVIIAKHQEREYTFTVDPSITVATLRIQLEIALGIKNAKMYVKSAEAVRLCD